MVFEKKVVFVLLFLMSVGLVSSAAQNDIVSEFDVKGCEVAGVYFPAGECSYDGGSYCDDGEPRDTRTGGSPANMWCDVDGDNSYAAGDPQCCPTGFKCSDVTGNCEFNDVICSSYDIEVDCDGASDCYWIAPTGATAFCSERPQDYSCSVYENDENACNADNLNLGQIGFGTENCNNYTFYDDVSDSERGYVSPGELCGCVFENNDCYFRYSILPDVYGAAIDQANHCYLNFTSGFCVDGKQSVTWTARARPITGTLFEREILEPMGCVGGSSERTCGEQIIRLPGFSLFSFFASIGLLVLFYVFRKGNSYLKNL